MRLLALVGAVSLLGCFSPKYSNGQLKCGPAAHPCPDGYYCARNNTCWQNNAQPALDMSVALDLAPADLATSSTDMPPPGPRHQGQACGPANTCDTGFCVDGYCCNSICNNTCQACNVTGNLGICTNVGTGQSPVGARNCNAQPAASCGRDGKCDGQGNCRDWPSGTACSAGTCDTSTGNFVNASTCNGTGSCVANGGGNCAPFKCQDTTQCYQTCSSSSQCSGSNMCVGSSCGQLPDGRKCTTGAQCLNGNCVDGYCCNSSCVSSCQACDVSGSLGVCTTVPPGSPHGTRKCNNQGQSPCGGSCNGSTADCSYAPKTMPCGTACTSGQLQQSFCDANGSCTPAAPMICSGHYSCPAGASACLAKCSSNSDCYPTTGWGCSNSGSTASQCEPFCVISASETIGDNCIFAP